ncbi:hypothetical protein DVH24_002270 [Malus domestica]|uniref:Uncharacterized protein n=1 Tax=Malus domestica TaxID=3750 RepID=A0A498I953_MALDO|nr:hypothetical protein DVH24_002270 [Malus domestica]
MPKIPEIAKCPDELMSLKQWEDASLAEFTELRLEVDFHWPHGCSIVGSSIDQPSPSTNIGSNASLPAENLSPKPYASQSSSPLLPVILKKDSVALSVDVEKRIKVVEDMITLSRNDCLWLFALCAAVDNPLDADTSPSLRSLLRKSAALRAAKSVLDDEVVIMYSSHDFR